MHIRFTDGTNGKMSKAFRRYFADLSDDALGCFISITGSTLPRLRLGRFLPSSAISLMAVNHGVAASSWSADHVVPQQLLT